MNVTIQKVSVRSGNFYPFPPLTLICRALSKKFMPGILSFLGHLCCSDFEKFTFFSISREDNRKFLKKNFCFSKKFHRQGLWGGRSFLKFPQQGWKFFQKSTQQGWRENFSKIYSRRMKTKIYKKFTQQERRIFS